MRDFVWNFRTPCTYNCISIVLKLQADLLGVCYQARESTHLGKIYFSTETIEPIVIFFLMTVALKIMPIKRLILLEQFLFIVDFDFQGRKLWISDLENVEDVQIIKPFLGHFVKCPSVPTKPLPIFGYTL